MTMKAINYGHFRRCHLKLPQFKISAGIYYGFMPYFIEKRQFVGNFALYLRYFGPTLSNFRPYNNFNEICLRRGVRSDPRCTESELKTPALNRVNKNLTIL